MRVYVKTPARLHLGLIDLRGDWGRKFGGLGVGIDHPNIVLNAQKSKELLVMGEKSELARSLARKFLDIYNIESNAEIHVKQTIPEHSGLGSGTQLALAIATSLAKLFNIKVSTQELASVMGRGQRTAVGTSIFSKGGFVVDGGKPVENGVCLTKKFSPIIFRQPFPEDWRFVVAIPSIYKGLANEEESTAFRNLPLVSAEAVGKICRQIVIKILPALMEHDIKNFGESLTQIQTLVGENFAEVQGGRYSNQAIAEGIEFMRSEGAHGVGQSSWGPAFYGLTQNEEEAERIQSRMKTFLGTKQAEVFVARANNKGACIRVTENAKP